MPVERLKRTTDKIAKTYWLQPYFEKAQMLLPAKHIVGDNKRWRGNAQLQKSVDKDGGGDRIGVGGRCPISSEDRSRRPRCAPAESTVAGKE